jgi:uncharacterized LabA/DUF88 family protein
MAVLIDADNISPKYSGPLLEELAKYGRPTIKRAYGDFSSSQMAGWRREQHTRGVVGIHVPAFTRGKNSSDSALIIDAMDLLYAGNVDAFAIVSSDSDFTRLAHRLREEGKLVYGLGRDGTPQSLQNAVDQFIVLEVLGAGGDEEEPEQDDDSVVESAPRLNLQSVLTKAVNATADDGGWSSLSALGSHISRSHPSFDTRNYGHAKLSSLVTDQGYLATRTEGKDVLVALKGQHTPPKAEAKDEKAPRKTAKKAAKKTAAKATGKTAAKATSKAASKA